MYIHHIMQATALAAHAAAKVLISYQADDDDNTDYRLMTAAVVVVIGCGRPSADADAQARLFIARARHCAICHRFTFSNDGAARAAVRGRARRARGAR